MVHAIGLMGMLRWILRLPVLTDSRFWPQAWQLIRIAGCLITIHLLEIAIWAIFYWRQECFPDAESAFYFSGVTYTTVGYGDLVLPKEWRILGPVEGLTGILMSGLSTGFFFAIMSKLYMARVKAE